VARPAQLGVHETPKLRRISGRERCRPLLSGREDLPFV
jgi:hypothetical protein